jgi:hypothetical protein
MTPIPEPHWTAYLTALLTPVVAILAAVIAGSIAYRNWRTAQNKLKFDMFAMRYKIYEELTELMTVWSDKWEMQKSMQEFYSLQQRAAFLFNDQVNEYLNKTLLPKLHEYGGNFTQLNGNNPVKDGQALMGRDLQLKIWMASAKRDLKEVFKKDLKLTH